MQNVANGANLSTATVADEAKYFGQMSGDLSTVAELASGRVAVLAQSGSVAAAQARVRLLGGYGLGGSGSSGAACDERVAAEVRLSAGM